jgi:hypothetical protein
MPYSPYSSTVRTWLRNNLGKNCLAPLTSQDSLALDAATQTAALWAYTRRENLAAAFAATVQQMQPSTQHLAYHVVAHAGNWSDRQELWDLAGLPSIPIRRCSGESE